MVPINTTPNLKTRQQILEDTSGIYEPYDFEASAEERERNEELNGYANTYDTYNTSAVDFNEVYAEYVTSETNEQPSRLKKVFRRFKWYFAGGILLLLIPGMV